MIWGLDLEDIEKGGRLLEHKTVGERRAVGDKTVFAKGDILYSKLRPYLLKILVAPDDGICTPEIVPFRVYGGINPNYIVNYLKSPYVDNLINSITYGVKMPRVGTETMTTLLVPIPPMDEQRRIVEKIDEVAAAVSAYDVAYQKTETLNSTFPEAIKKSILQEAVQGKERIYTHGEKEILATADRMKNGLDVDVKTLAEMKDLSEYVGADFNSYCSEHWYFGTDGQ